MVDQVDRSKPLFEGAEGRGRFCQGGNGGTPIKVTRLDDEEDAEGTLRWALSQKGPRIITCALAKGILTLQKPIYITEPRVRLDFSNSRVCIRGGSLILWYTWDIHIKNTVIRPGPSYTRRTGLYIDAISIEQAEYVYIEHNSLSWGSDELMSVQGGGRNITIIENFIVQPSADPTLHVEHGEPQRHAYCSISGGTNTDWIRNLWAMYIKRGPRVTQTYVGTRQRIVNNMMYGYENSGSMGALWDYEDVKIMVFGNHYEQPESLGDSVPEWIIQPKGPSDTLERPPPVYPGPPPPEDGAPNPPDDEERAKTVSDKPRKKSCFARRKNPETTRKKKQESKLFACLRGKSEKKDGDELENIRFYVHGNIGPRRNSDNLPQLEGWTVNSFSEESFEDCTIVDPPTPKRLSDITNYRSAQEAREYVLSSAGVQYADGKRDPVDQFIVDAINAREFVLLETDPSYAPYE